MAKVNEEKVKRWGAFFNGMTMRQCYEFLKEDLPDLHAPLEAEIACKRRIRGIAKSADDYLESNRIIKEYGIDGYVYREVLNATNIDDAETEFRCNHRREYVPSPYDCTGQAFTEWHRIFRINGKYVLYHSVGFDV